MNDKYNNFPTEDMTPEERMDRMFWWRKEKTLTYASIGKLFDLSKQRTHQLLTKPPKWYKSCQKTN